MVRETYLKNNKTFGYHPHTWKVATAHFLLGDCQALMKNKRMTRAQRLEHCKRIVAIPWPEEGSANYKAEQDEYFAATRLTGDPDTLDLFPRPRRVAWQTLWKRRDSAEDTIAAAEGNTIKTMERKAISKKKGLARKKKLSPQEASSAPPPLFNYVAGQLLDKESDIGWRAEQQAAVSSLTCTVNRALHGSWRRYCSVCVIAHADER